MRLIYGQTSESKRGPEIDRRRIVLEPDKTSSKNSSGEIRNAEEVVLVVIEKGWTFRTGVESIPREDALTPGRNGHQTTSTARTVIRAVNDSM